MARRSPWPDGAAPAYRRVRAYPPPAGSRRRSRPPKATGSRDGLQACSKAGTWKEQYNCLRSDGQYVSARMKEGNGEWGVGSGGARERGSEGAGEWESGRQGDEERYFFSHSLTPSLSRSPAPSLSHSPAPSLPHSPLPTTQSQRVLSPALP